MMRLPVLAAAALVTLVLPTTPVRAAMDGDALPGIGTQRAVKAPVLDTICLLVEAAAVAVVAREGKASTSFIQRHLTIGYNKAAKLIEQMEKEGIVTPANHVGKREILVRRTGDED